MYIHRHTEVCRSLHVRYNRHPREHLRHSYTHTHTHTHTHTPTYIYTYSYVYICIYIDKQKYVAAFEADIADIHESIRIICTHTHTHTHSHTDICICIFIHVYTYIYIDTHKYVAAFEADMADLHESIRVMYSAQIHERLTATSLELTQVYTHTRAHTNTPRTDTPLCTHTQIYAHIYTCESSLQHHVFGFYTHTHTHTLIHSHTL